MGRIKNIKDWLKERSEPKQFRAIQSINGNLSAIIRNSDGLEFRLGTNTLNDTSIVKFHEDLIHVDMTAWFLNNTKSEPEKRRITIQANGLGKYQSADYKLELM